jgi:tetratricopeptide (TPR) repeat protein
MMVCSRISRHTSLARSIRFSILVFVFLAVIADMMITGEPPQANQDNAEAGLERGISLVSSGRFAESLAVFNQFKHSSPLDSRPYFYSAMAFKEAGRLSAAALELQEAVRLAPGKAEYLVLQANVLAQLEQDSDALDALSKVEREDPSKMEAAWLKMLARTYLRLWKTDEALKVLALLGERSPKDAEVDLDRGKVCMVKGQFGLAQEALNRSIEKESANNPVAYFELGKILYQDGKLQASKSALLKAVEQDQGNAEYFFQLGVVCLAGDEVDEAITNLQRAEWAASAFPGIYASLGKAYRRKGNRARAEEYNNKFQEAASAQREKDDRTRTVDRLITQGEAQLDNGNVGDAGTLFEQAALADPNRWEPHGYLAEMLLDSGDLDRAYPHLAKMEAIEPDSVVGKYLLAKYYFARNEFERAREYAEWVRLRRPANSELRGLLGIIYEKLRRPADATGEYEVAVQLAPGRADFQESLRRTRRQESQAKPIDPGKIPKP